MDEKEEAGASEKQKEESDLNTVKLDWKDYVAFTLALLQTVALPAILMLLLLLIIGILVGIWMA